MEDDVYGIPKPKGTDSFEPEHLGIDAGQDLFDGIGRGAVLRTGIFGGR